MIPGWDGASMNPSQANPNDMLWVYARLVQVVNGPGTREHAYATGILLLLDVLQNGFPHHLLHPTCKEEYTRAYNSMVRDIYRHTLWPVYN